MDPEEELRKTIQGVKDKQERQQAEADQQRRAVEQQTTAEARMVEEFVRTILPGVVDELLPKVGTIAGQLVPTASGSPGNQFHGSHHDWHYAFSVRNAEAVVDSCERTLDIRISGKPYRTNGLDRDAAIRLFTTVVERGLAG